LFGLQSFAQDNNYRVGERVEYKDRSYPEVWKEGTIVRVAPEYNQVIVRWDPRDDYPSYTRNGVSTYEQAYNFSDVRHISNRTNNTTANPQAVRANVPTTVRMTPAAANVASTGPMSKQEIIGYMRSHGYANGRPIHSAQVCRDLVELIKRQGVQERLEVGKDDLSPFADNGCYNEQATDVVAASKTNIGAPTTLDWLDGAWIMYVVGGTVDTAPGDGYIYRKNESLAKLGFLTIHGDGTYTWKVNPTDPPAKYVSGTWRRATAAEMNLQGGAGIVLQHAAEGADWIVFKYMDPINKADRIEVEHIQYRGSYRRIGWRK
jgi:hypothetical protein